MIDFLEARYAADPARIYCTGFSNGASMTFSVGLNLANRIAAIAPVSGHLWYRKSGSPIRFRCSSSSARDDPLNPIDGGNVKLPWGKTENVPPIEDSLKEWERMLGCGPQVQTARGNGVLEITYDQCAKGGEVEYYRVRGLGHIWPGGNNRLPEKWVGKPSDSLNATDVIWEFFKAHPRTAGVQTDREERLTRLVAGRFDDRLNVLHSTVVRNSRDPGLADSSLRRLARKTPPRRIAGAAVSWC